MESNSSRRAFLKSSTLTLAAASVSSVVATEATAQTAPARPLSSSPAGGLFVETHTAYGKVQGIQNVGIKEFKGIPYGASTAGRNRFMPPKKPPPTQMQNDPRSEIRTFWERMPPPGGPLG